MRIPARYVAGNLVFTFEGTCWAVLRVEPPTYGRLPRKDKLAWHNRVSAALMSMPGESMLLGVTMPLEPDAVVAAMIDGVDIARNPRWAEVALDTLDNLTEAGISTRAHFVAFCLPAAQGAGRLTSAAGAAMARMSQRLRMAPLPVSAAMVKAARHQADDLTKPLVGFLGDERVRPATEAEIQWLYARASLRGAAHLERRGDREVSLCDEPSLGEFTEEGPASVLTAARLAAVGEVALYEGGDETDADRPRHRRYIRADGERATCYQTFAVLSHLPREWTFPDGRGEILAHLDESEIPVDWCVRIRPKPNTEAQFAITGQIRQLSGQFGEYEGDLAGAPESLSDAIERMRDELSTLIASPSVPELQSTFILGLGAPDLATLEERYERLRAFLEANEYTMPRPTGDQRALWGAMLPGYPLPGVCSDYTQYHLPADIAGCAPFTGSGLGDASGDLLGLNLDASGRPVLFWAGAGPNTSPPDGPKSGSVGVFGRLGGGKSYAIKRIVAGTVDMGGRVIVTDRTPMGEYVRLAEPLQTSGHSAQVITIGAEARVCLDPLRVFEGEDRVRYGVGFLTLLTGTPPTDPQGAVLAESVRRVAQRPGGRLGDVVADLREVAAHEDPAFAEAASLVALKVQVFTRGGLASLVFGDGPPVSLEADYSVFHAPNLELPSRQALAERRQLMPDQVFSQALLYLVTAVARHVAFSERHRFSLVVQDEGYVLSASPQGTELLDQIMRDGRKHNAALLFASHHPDDLPERLQELLGSRFLFRMDRNAAAAGLAFMGMEATEANVAAIEESARQVGQCLYRDLSGRLGLLHVLPPRTPDLRRAFDTGLSAASAEANGAGRGRVRRPRVSA